MLCLVQCLNLKPYKYLFCYYYGLCSYLTHPLIFEVYTFLHFHVACVLNMRYRYAT